MILHTIDFVRSGLVAIGGGNGSSSDVTPVVPSVSVGVVEDGVLLEGWLKPEFWLWDDPLSPCLWFVRDISVPALKCFKF